MQSGVWYGLADLIERKSGPFPSGGISSEVHRSDRIERCPSGRIFGNKYQAAGSLWDPVINQTPHYY